MSSAGATGEITLTDRKEVIERMRRLGLFQKDSKGKEFYETTYDAKPIKFYIGYAVRLPLDWVKSLVGGNEYGVGMNMPMDEKCKNCKGSGATNAGECNKCKGTGWVDTNKRYRMFKLISANDPLDFDAAEQPQRKLGETLDQKEAESSLA